MYDKVSQPVAVVTGGSAGIGAAFVERLRANGFRVAVLDLASPSWDPAEGSVLWHLGDATRSEDVAEFAARVRQELGPPRVLVNNVGASPYRAFRDESLDSWRAVMAANVESCVLATGAFLDDLLGNAHSRIITMCSSVHWDAETRGMVAYTAAKGAVLGLTRALAAELGAQGLTVSALAPGIVVTPDTARLSESDFERYRMRQSVPRIATPADLLSALDFLVSEESDHVTGLVLGVNGGRVWL